jgi:hypothetical protein
MNGMDDKKTAGVAWRERSVRDLPISIALVNALYAVPLETLGALFDYWGDERTLLTAGGFTANGEIKLLKAWNEFVRAHPEVPAVESHSGESTKMQTTPSNDPTVPADADTLRKLVAQYEEVFGEVAHFIKLIARQEIEISERQLVVNATKEKFETAKSELAQSRESRDGTKHALFMFLKPGPTEILPLFDRMEPAKEEKHGKHSDEWRKEPISALRLSLMATNLLTAADVIFVGQLQDRVQAKPADWWKETEGITDPMAAAIGDLLNDFIAERTK